MYGLYYILYARVHGYGQSSLGYEVRGSGSRDLNSEYFPGTAVGDYLYKALSAVHYYGLSVSGQAEHSHRIGNALFFGPFLRISHGSRFWRGIYAGRIRLAVISAVLAHGVFSGGLTLHGCHMRQHNSAGAVSYGVNIPYIGLHMVVDLYYASLVFNTGRFQSQGCRGSLSSYADKHLFGFHRNFLSALFHLYGSRLSVVGYGQDSGGCHYIHAFFLQGAGYEINGISVYVHKKSGEHLYYRHLCSKGAVCRGHLHSDDASAYDRHALGHAVQRKGSRTVYALGRIYALDGYGGWYGTNGDYIFISFYFLFSVFCYDLQRGFIHERSLSLNDLHSVGLKQRIYSAHKTVHHGSFVLHDLCKIQSGLGYDSRRRSVYGFLQ